MEPEVLRARRPEECQEDHRRDEGTRPRHGVMDPLHDPREEELAEKDRAADEQEHHPEDDGPLPLGGGVRAELGKDHGKQTPADEIVDERRRHDRPPDVALEQPHVEEDSRDDRIGREGEERPHEERRREAVFLGDADHRRKGVAHQEAENERNERPHRSHRERLAAEAAELADGDVEADRDDEEQHPHARDRVAGTRHRAGRRKEPGERLGGESAKDCRPEHKPAGDLADDGRDPEFPGHLPEDKRRQQHRREVERENCPVGRGHGEVLQGANGCEAVAQRPRQTSNGAREPPRPRNSPTRIPVETTVV